MPFQSIIPSNLDPGEKLVEVAVLVLEDRFRHLSDSDLQDIRELLPELTCDEEERRESALVTFREILIAPPAQVRRMDLEDTSTTSLAGWLTFFSERLKLARHEAGMTQQELAGKSGIPQPHLSRLENSQHSPSAKTLEKLAEALNKPVTYFDPSA